jgi:hypothetical protein
MCCRPATTTPIICKAQKIRTLIKRDFETGCREGIDAMLTPATPSAAFGLGEKGSSDPVEMYLNDVFTVTVNMAGLPGIAVPAGVDSQGLPLGLQLIGRPFDEETLFAPDRSSRTPPAASRSARNGGPKRLSSPAGVEGDRSPCVLQDARRSISLF